MGKIAWGEEKGINLTWKCRIAGMCLASLECYVHSKQDCRPGAMVLLLVQGLKVQQRAGSNQVETLTFAD